MYLVELEILEYFTTSIGNTNVQKRTNEKVKGICNVHCVMCMAKKYKAHETLHFFGNQSNN